MTKSSKLRNWIADKGLRPLIKGVIVLESIRSETCDRCGFDVMESDLRLSQDGSDEIICTSCIKYERKHRDPWRWGTYLLPPPIERHRK